MNDAKLTTLSLDDLSVRAAAGEREAESVLFETLRVRLLAVGKRRVRQDDLDDVTQEALRIVHSRYQGRKSKQGILIWSYAVLRNVIGNYYQKRRRLDRGEAFDERVHSACAEQPPAGVGIPLGGEIEDRLLEAIARLARRESRCGTLFFRLLESLDQGGSSREISQRAFTRLREDFPDVERGNLYVALHRCRNQLRGILREMEEGVGS